MMKTFREKMTHFQRSSRLHLSIVGKADFSEFFFLCKNVSLVHFYLQVLES